MRDAKGEEDRRVMGCALMEWAVGRALQLASTHQDRCGLEAIGSVEYSTAGIGWGGDQHVDI
jgi:hypothetical protein